LVGPFKIGGSSIQIPLKGFPKGFFLEVPPNWWANQELGKVHWGQFFSKGTNRCATTTKELTLGSGLNLLRDFTPIGPQGMLTQLRLPLIP